MIIGVFAIASGCGAGNSSDSANLSKDKTPAASPVDSKDQPSNEASQEKSGQAGKPDGRAPKVKVISTYVNDEPDVYFRFAVKVTNPAGRPRDGVTVEWKAKDADGVIVGSFKHEVALIPAEDDVVYVGGAGGGPNLTGTPDSVDVEVIDEGKLVDPDATLPVKIGKTAFERQEFSIFEGADTYTASVVITALEDVKTEDFNTAVVLRDDNDEIVGMGFGDNVNMLEALAAGEKFKVTSDIQVPTDAGEPTMIEAWID